MNRAAQLFLFITLTLWATVIGGIMYSHIVYFPPYLGHLPESTALLNGPYGLHDENFWMLIHPVLILSLIITVILNWKLKARRKYIFIAMGIYALAIIATATYFLPELFLFAKSNESNAMTPTEWINRGQTWQYLSWVRGFFMYVGFVLLLIALINDRKENGNG